MSETRAPYKVERAEEHPLYTLQRADQGTWRFLRQVVKPSPNQWEDGAKVVDVFYDERDPTNQIEVPVKPYMRERSR